MKKATNSYFILIFSFIWLIIIDKMSDDLGFRTQAVLVNYATYVLMAAWFFYAWINPGSAIKTRASRNIHKSLSQLTFLYMLFTFLQVFINPSNSSLVVLRQNYSMVFPSIALALLIPAYSIRREKRPLKTIKIVYYSILAVAIISEFVVGESAENASGEGRIGGVFGQANGYGHFLALLLVMTVADMVDYWKVTPNKTISFIIFLFTLGLIFRTGSYGTLTVSVITSLYLSFNYLSKLKLSRFLVMGLGIIAVAIAVSYYTSSISTARFDALKDLAFSGDDKAISEESTFELRFQLLEEGLSAFGKDALVGRGIKGRTIDINGHKIPVHNAFVVEALKGGLSTLLPLVFMYLLFFRNVMRMKSKTMRRIALTILIYLFFIDNTRTYSTFLSLNSGLPALIIIFTLVYMDNEARKSDREVMKESIQTADLMEMRRKFLR